MKKGKILIVDDNEDILFTLKMLLRPLAEQVTTLDDPREMLPLLSRVRHDVILLDMNFRRDAVSGREGFAWLEETLKLDPQAVVIFITAYSDTEKAVQAIKQGATDFIPKPWQNDKLLATVSAALQLSFSRHEVKVLKEQKKTLEQRAEALATPAEPTHIIGESAAMQALLQTVRKCSDTDARRPKPGRMEAATGGTLFLNEIGNLSLPMQAKLLSVIEQRRASRLGSTTIYPVDVRLICATNTDLYAAIDRREFRQDLLYRINTIELRLPPLRERGNDLFLLADFFVQRYARKYHKEIKGIGREARRQLQQYRWPGNVRELEHAVERAVILTSGPMLAARDFHLQSRLTHEPLDEKERYNLERIERESIDEVLRLCNGNITLAAEMLGITRTSLYRRIEKYKL